MKQQVLRLLSTYQGYRALRPAACRFQPTCSHFASEAIETHGLVRGAWLAMRRISRCHPLGSHGYDPVPPARTGQHPSTTAPLAAAFGSPTVRTPCD